MSTKESSPEKKIALTTGASKRIGAAIARFLHEKGFQIILHYNESISFAKQLQKELNNKRTDSVYLLQSNLSNIPSSQSKIIKAVEHFGKLDVLVNNASCFSPTPLTSSTEKQWDDILNVNLKAPYFLVKMLRPYLKDTCGCVINITDVYTERPLFEHAIYCASKAGLLSLTKSLAQELGPDIRVNAIAPGVIFWPENETDETRQQQIIDKTPLKRTGCAEDIAKAVYFLSNDASFISGQTLTVDGGKTIVG